MRRRVRTASRSPDAEPGPSRRDVLRGLGAMASLHALLPAYAGCGSGATGRCARGRVASELLPQRDGGVSLYELTIAETPVAIGDRCARAITVNGTVPGPLLHLHEGQEVLLRVHNRLDEDTSVHWHGVLVPEVMDGVPGVSFPGILPHSTFEYRFRLRQYGTYWYHSHSKLQEQLGHYGPLLIHPVGGYPYDFDREHTIVLSDWTFESPYRVLAKLQEQGNYYNQQRLTVFDFLSDAADDGLGATLRDRLMWARMRMDPTDILDVTSATYSYLLNGLTPADDWTGLFRPGERVLLRVINASAATYFDVRVPGLPLQVVQSNGQFVEPVITDELRIAVAETYDLIVEPGDRAYTFFAETMDRGGHALGTLAPRPGMSAPVPAPRPRPRLTMADMGMVHGGGGHADMDGDATSTAHGAHGAHRAQPDVAVAGAIRSHGLRPPGTVPPMARHEDDEHGPGNAGVPDMVRSRLHEPGVGLGGDGWRVLSYSQLRALHPEPRRPPTREIELHLTGNMERFMWSINGVGFADAELIHFDYGERIRLTMVNDTMMNHPMHLHGMWMELENGQGQHIPRVHTINVQPAERLSLLITADAPGMWAFHCHILYHMNAGMFRVVQVSQPGPAPSQRGHGR